ncbi:hypothetical protein OIU79_000986 [Salix purpurea]|uniref:Uncharacterized protein n=1 Tax=Salix purpurea TaxID=77065 RepID=A0A9Q0V3D7_SALPP|nr:hypothetical protein OIU79_000986 [Salix purpurea]
MSHLKIKSKVKCENILKNKLDTELKCENKLETTEQCGKSVKKEVLKVSARSPIGSSQNFSETLRKFYRSMNVPCASTSSLPVRTHELQERNQEEI